MSDLITQLKEVEVLVRNKHQAGRHSQADHTPKKYSKGGGDIGKGWSGKPATLATQGSQGAGTEYTKTVGNRTASLEVYPDAYGGAGYVMWETRESGYVDDYGDGMLTDAPVSEFADHLNQFLSGAEVPRTTGRFRGDPPGPTGGTVGRYEE